MNKTENIIIFSEFVSKSIVFIGIIFEINLNTRLRRDVF
jgi:hypothetical protein